MSEVSVIIVTHNSAAYLPNCLASVTTEQGNEFEVIVVDNASTDLTRTLVRDRFPSVLLLENKRNRGFAAGVNQALRQAKGRFILLLNPDAELLPSAVATLAHFLETTPNAAAAGPRQWLNSTMTWQWSIVPRMPVWRLTLQRSHVFGSLGLADKLLREQWALNRAIWREDQPCSVPFLSGACLLLRRQALSQVDGLDEGYFLFGEDVDLCARLTSRGWTLFAVPQAEAIHRGFHSVELTPDKGRHHLMASTARYLRRHESLLTRVVWALVAARQITHTRHRLEEERLSNGQDDHPHVEITSDTPPWWVEVGLESLFLYTAAAEIDSSPVVLPDPLARLARRGPLYVRLAPIEPDGRLGPLARQRTLRSASISIRATSWRQRGC